MSSTIPPVVIADYDPRWREQYAVEQRAIHAAIGDVVAAVEHIGSTAVPGLASKPIIDIMVGVRCLDDASRCIEPLRQLAYVYVPEFEAEMPERRYFRKGSRDARTHHLHMVEVGSEFWVRHLLFRDYLRAHPESARAYTALKRGLAAAYGSDHTGYTEAKTAFIRSVEARARDEERNRR